MNTPHETTSEEKCCINCDDLGNCAFVDCKCHYAMSEEVKKAFGMDIIIDESLPENTFVLSNDVKKEVKRQVDIEFYATSRAIDSCLRELPFGLPEQSMLALVEYIRTQRSLAQQEGYEQCKKELSQQNKDGFSKGIDIGQSSMLYEIQEIIKKERDTWARESIGDKALQSLERALDVYILSTLKDTNI